MAEKISFSSTESQVKPPDRRQWENWSTRTKGITILTIVMVVLFVITLPIVLLRKSNVLILMEDKPQLVVVMLSGMRWDYVERLPPDKLGGFNQFKKNGVRVEHVDTVFPSLKMSAWTTLQTGLYPEDHNVLGNRMLDESSGLRFDWEDETVSKLPLWWQHAEPVWITVSNQGKRVATLEWSSADVPYRGQLPEIAKGYSRSKMSFSERIEEVELRLIQGFDLTMMFYEGVDEKAREFGPASKEVLIEIFKVGQGLQQLFDFVDAHGRLNNTNILVVSDRGRAPTCNVSPINDMFLKNQPDDVVVMQDDAMFLMYTSRDREAEVISRLQDIPGYEAHRLEDLPVEFHYKRGLYAPRVVSFPIPATKFAADAVRNSSHGATSAPERTTMTEKVPSTSGSCDVRGGVCGLDPRRTPEMRTMLLGWGDAFAGRGLVHPPVHLVDVYQIFFHILGLPAPLRPSCNWKAVRGMLNTCALRKGNDADKFKHAKKGKFEAETRTEETTSTTKKNVTSIPFPFAVESNGFDCNFDVDEYLFRRQQATIEWETQFMIERSMWIFGDDINLL